MNRIVKCMYRYLKEKRWISTERIRSTFSKLYKGTAKQMEEAVDNYYIDLFRKSLLLILLAAGISGIVWWMDALERKQGIHLIRGDYGEDEVVYKFRYQGLEDSQQELSVVLEPVEYQYEELRNQFQQGFSYLEQRMLGENPALNQIQGNLNLVTGIPDSGLTVSWTSDDYEVLEENGIVKNDNLTKEQKVHLLLELRYGDWLESREYELVILPKILTEVEAQNRQIQRELAQLLQESRYEKEVTLPRELQGVELKEAGNSVPRALVIFIVGIGMTGLLWLRQKEMLYRQLKQRKQELEQEYPYLVNQLLLYIGAGATVKGAFERILRQYVKRNRQNSSLYQELLIMQNEMNSGVTQEQAYSNLGKRIALLPYRKLTSLLAQQIRKGVGSLTIPLEEEEHMAFEHRKEQAKRAGEEAGTKLLLPMILLMVISVVIVVCPALMNFM